MEKEVVIQRQCVDADIELYLQYCLKTDVKLKRWSVARREEIRDALVQGAHGMYVRCEVLY